MIVGLALMKVFLSSFCRTARGDNVGTALSFVTANDHKLLKQAEEELTKEFTGTSNAKVIKLCFSNQSGVRYLFYRLHGLMPFKAFIRSHLSFLFLAFSF